MRAQFTLLTAIVPLAFLGCSGDDPTGLNAIPIEGTWSFTAKMSDDVQSCSETGTTLVIQRDGSTFVGTITGGLWSCTDGNVTIEVDLNESSLAVYDGVIDGQAISFEFLGTGGGRASLTGTAGASFMSGTGSWRGGAATLNGTWSATRP